ncbi:MAG: M15 family metallopeptidase [Actinomycetota bacterium]|nr:M15 family metallopeptidase [Actinomycetota bacterium]
MKRLSFKTLLALVLVGSLVWISVRALTDQESVLLAWTPGSLPSGLAASAATLPGVEAVAEVRNGVAWLSAWSAEGAESVSTPPSGFFIPMEVAAIDPQQYAAILPAGEREPFLQLSRGEALMGRSGADLRGISNAGSLRFRDGTVSVQGVVEDDLVASHEVVVPRDTGEALGIVTPRYLLISLDSSTSREEVEEGLRRLLPARRKLQVRAYGEARVLRPGDPVLPHVQVKRIFGEFAARPGRGSAIRIDPGWIVENTTNATIPLVGRVRCHVKIIPQMRAAFEEISQEGLASKIRRSDFGGCFSPRRISSDPYSPISHHAWGIGFDVNVSQNPYGRTPRLDQGVVQIMEKHGFVWGGRWLVPDGMHFEYLREPE